MLIINLNEVRFANNRQCSKSAYNSIFILLASSAIRRTLTTWHRTFCLVFTLLTLEFHNGPTLLYALITATNDSEIHIFTMTRNHSSASSQNLFILLPVLQAPHLRPDRGFLLLLFYIEVDPENFARSKFNALNLVPSVLRTIRRQTLHYSQAIQYLLSTYW